MIRDGIKVLGACALLSVPAAAETGRTLELLPVGAGDLAPSLVHPAPPGPHELVLRASREAVDFAWALDPAESLDLAERPFVARSKEYWTEVTATELRDGVDLFATAPGALVRVNPVSGIDKSLARQRAVDPLHLEVVGAEGRPLRSGAAMDLVARARELEESGSPFPPGTAAFRLAPELGAGRFTVRARQLQAPDESRYVVHLFDQGSPVELAAHSPRGSYLHGQAFRLEAVLTDGEATLEAARMDGFLVSPAGRTFPLELHRGEDGAFRGTLHLEALEAPAPGLWEVHATAVGTHDGRHALRAVRSAFAVAVPTARLTGLAQVRRQAAGEEALEVGFGVEAASAGRFEVRGVLFGTDSDGALRPLAAAHSAAWLEAGEGTLVLRFGEELVRTSGLGEPFELRDLQLVDQPRMGILHRQQRALALAD